MSNLIPADVRRAMQESGVEFDEEGNIIEKSLFLKDETKPKPKKKPTSQTVEEPVLDDDDEEEQNENDEEEVDLEEDDLEEDDLEEDDQDKDEDENEDDDEEPVAKPKLTPKVALTPKAKKVDTPSDKTDGILERLAELIDRKPTAPAKAQEPAPKATALEQEVESFRKLRMQQFAKMVESDVNQMDLGAKFQDIIASEEWSSYLDSKVLGVQVRNLYVEAIKENDSGTVASFFTDFAKRHLTDIKASRKVSKPLAKVKSEKTEKPSLDALAVPSRSKSISKPKRSKFDFDENDYAVNLNLFERGKLSYDKFYEFESKFNTALSQNRVRPSS